MLKRDLRVYQNSFFHLFYLCFTYFLFSFKLEGSTALKYYCSMIHFPHLISGTRHNSDISIKNRKNSSLRHSRSWAFPRLFIRLMIQSRQSNCHQLSESIFEWNRPASSVTELIPRLLLQYITQSKWFSNLNTRSKKPSTDIHTSPKQIFYLLLLLIERGTGIEPVIS